MQRHAGGKAAQIFPALLGFSGLLNAAGLVGLAVNAGQWGLYCAAAGLGLAATLLWLRQAVLDTHEKNLERLIGGIEAAAGSTNPHLPPLGRDDLDARLERLLNAAAALISRLATPAATEARLAAILGALPQPLIVVTEQGLISLANQPARDQLGAAKVHAGTSVFDAFDDAGLAPLLARLPDEIFLEARLHLATGATCNARLRALPEHGGAVIVLDSAAAGAAGLVQDLDLHEPVPPRTPPRSETPLTDLALVVLDCETTGLDIDFDRIVSLATIRVHGARLVRSETIDLLFDPGQPIPDESTRIHGITDAMVFGERTLAERWPEIDAALRDCVVVGHNIGFDLAILENELRRAGIKWQRPLSLCTLQLAAAIEPQLDDLNLETLAGFYGLPVSGRHTAFGDALMTARLYLHLLALMQARGDRTLADAQARAATARRVIRQQQEAGW